MTDLKTLITELDLGMDFEFIPYSKSRSYKPGMKPRDRSLNWRVTLLRHGKEVLSTDYTAGSAHCPSNGKYKSGAALEAEALEYETEFGRAFRENSPTRGRLILPKTEDVIHSLIMDAGAIDYPTFEAWADEYGYDPDSRKAEAIYRTCLGIGLELLKALSRDDLARLQEAAAEF